MNFGSSVWIWVGKNSLEPLHNLLALMVKKTNRQNLLRDVPSKLTSPSPGHPQHRTDRRAHTLHFPFYHHNHPVRQAGQVAFKSPLPVPSALFTAPEPRIGSRETLSTLGSTSLPGLPTPGFQDLWAAHAFKTLSPALHTASQPSMSLSPTLWETLSALQVSSLASYQNRQPRFSKLPPSFWNPSSKGGLSS